MGREDRFLYQEELKMKVALKVDKNFYTNNIVKCFLWRGCSLLTIYFFCQAAAFPQAPFTNSLSSYTFSCLFPHCVNSFSQIIQSCFDINCLLLLPLLSISHIKHGITSNIVQLMHKNNIAGMMKMLYKIS